MATELREARSWGAVKKGTGPEVPQLDDDNYRAMVKDVQEASGNWQGTEYEQYVIEFELLDEKKPNGEPVTLRAYVRIPDGVINDGILNEKSKLYELLKGLGYQDDNMEIEPAAWQGVELRIEVENREITTGDNKGQVRPRVTGFKPPKGAGPKQAEKAQATRQPAKRSTEDDEF